MMQMTHALLKSGKSLCAAASLQDGEAAWLRPWDISHSSHRNLGGRITATYDPVFATFELAPSLQSNLLY